MERIGGQERSVLIDRERSMFGEGRKATDQTKQNWSRIDERSIDHPRAAAHSSLALLLGIAGEELPSWSIHQPSSSVAKAGAAM